MESGIVRLGFASALIMAGTPACQFVPGLAGLNAQNAENPLKGEPVAWSRQAEGLPFEGEKACSTWPIEDSVTARATEAEVCVKAQVYQLVDARFSGPGETSLDIESDGSGGGLGERGLKSLKGRPSKVGSCADKAAAKTVWVTQFDGCTPNKSEITGKPALTHQSTFLHVGKARWKFPATAPASPAGPAASESAPPAAAAAPPSSPAPPAASGAPTSGAPASGGAASSGAPNAAAVKYKADVGKCMRGEPVDGASMVGGPTCKALRRAAQTGDASQLPKGAAQAFREIRAEGGR